MKIKNTLSFFVPFLMTMNSQVFAYSLDEYPNPAKIKLPQINLAVSVDTSRLAQAGDVKAKTNIDQSISKAAMTETKFAPAKVLAWQSRVLSEPTKKAVARTGMLPIASNRIPVYYQGEQQVIDRVVVFDTDGQMYFTGAFNGAEASGVYPQNKVNFSVANGVKASMNDNGTINYQPSNPYTAAKEGYIVRVNINDSKAATQYAFAPSLAFNGTKTFDFNASDASNGSKG
ncbi:MAG: hypothetical protein KAQ67_07755, partial [Gammaproteobacteria bacterium]|nr:hypothetical protein [Gammaproteobacteria bacterium]